jgi:hypothetical protein
MEQRLSIVQPLPTGIRHLGSMVRLLSKSIYTSYRLTDAELYHLRPITQNQEILGALAYLDLEKRLRTEYPVSINPKQDSRDCDAILRLICRMEHYFTGTSSTKGSVTMNTTCSTCLSEPRFEPHTRGSRYYKKGSANRRKRIYYVPSVIFGFGFELCVTCFIRIKPHMLKELRALDTISETTVKSLEDYVPSVTKYECNIGVAGD